MQVTKDGVAFSLSGKTLTYLVKVAASDPDASAILAFTSGDGLEITNPANGNFKITATAADMNLPRNYYSGALQIVDDATGAIIELPEDSLCDVWEVTGHLVLATA